MGAPPHSGCKGRKKGTTRKSETRSPSSRRLGGINLAPSMETVCKIRFCDAHQRTIASCDNAAKSKPRTLAIVRKWPRLHGPGDSKGCGGKGAPAGGDGGLGRPGP